MIESSSPLACVCSRRNDSLMSCSNFSIWCQFTGFTEFLCGGMWFFSAFGSGVIQSRNHSSRSFFFSHFGYPTLSLEPLVIRLVWPAMTYVTLLSCLLIVFGPPLALYVLVIAQSSQLIILSIGRHEFNNPTLSEFEIFYYIIDY
jgi:hypothetical protein